MNWRVKQEDFESVLERYDRYLKGNGFSESSIERYSNILRSFLKFANDAHPSTEKATEFRDHLIAKKQARATINNSCYALGNFYKMHSESFKFPILRVNNTIPYYFSEEEVHKIFDAASRNIKHLAMLQILFFGCLRASELCTLEDKDIDLKNLTIRVRNGKGNKDGIVFITPECAKTVHRYLEVRPGQVIDGKHYVFYTDYGRPWNREALHRMFILTKKRAGIEKPGAVHVFGRHTPATIMIAHGADVRVVQKILRHNDIKTTLRYTHVSDLTKRTMYDRCLVL
jgi:integrase/recombinase XerD